MTFLLWVQWLVVFWQSAPPSFAAVRVASTSPQLTELVFELGKGESLVATSSGTQFPEKARKLPSLGPLFFSGIEATVRSSADWVLVDAMATQSGYPHALKSLHIPYLLVSLSSFWSLFDEAQTILSKVFNEPLPRTFSKTRHCVERFQKPAIQGKTFLFFASLQPPFLVGPDTFLSSLIQIASGHSNLCPRLKSTPYPRVSNDWLLSHPPSMVFFLKPESNPTTLEPLNQSYETKEIRRWWPKNQVQIVALPEARFSRATLTTVKNAFELGFESAQRIKDCLGGGIE